jgi:hypothetical protein
MIRMKIDVEDYENETTKLIQETGVLIENRFILETHRLWFQYC